MSRTLKRVPLTFDWPLHKTWGGYINPYYQLATTCPDCEHGYDRARGRPDANAALFYEQWHGNAPFDWYAYGAKSPPLTQDHPAYRAAEHNVDHAPWFYLTAAEKGMQEAFRRGVMEGFPHDELIVPFPSFKKRPAIEAEARRLHALWRTKWSHHLIQADVDALVADGRLELDANGRPPTAEQVNALLARGNWHGAGSRDACVRARCEREGVPFICVRCGGTGTIWPSPEIERQCEEWKRTEPPTGDGYQLWQTCSEGSPISPVFTSLDELCAWAAGHATTFADSRASKEEWREMLESDCVHATDERGNIYL